jgi:hypothetical protein
MVMSTASTKEGPVEQVADGHRQGPGGDQRGVVAV